MKFLFPQNQSLFWKKNPRIFLFRSEADLERSVDRSWLAEVQKILAQSEAPDANFDDEQDKTKKLVGAVTDNLDLSLDRAYNIQSIREFLKSEELLTEFATNEALFHSRGRESADDLLAGALRQKLVGQLGEELMTDQVWSYFEKNLGLDFRDFQDRAKKEHVSHCSDEKAIEADKKELADSIDLTKHPDIQKQNFASFEEFISAWRENSAVKFMLDDAKGKKKELLEGAFLALVEKSFEEYNKNNQEKTNAREQLIPQKQEEVTASIESSIVNIKNRDDFETLDVESIQQILQEGLKEVDLMKLNKESAQKILQSAGENIAATIQEKIIPLQSQSRLKKSAEIFDSVLSTAKSQKSPKSASEYEDLVNSKLKDISFLRDLSPEVRAHLSADFESQCAVFKESLAKNEREKMGSHWHGFLAELGKYGQDFESFDEFQSFFLKKSGQSESFMGEYFAKHSNFSKTFAQSFENYQKGHKEKLEREFESVVSVISDEKIRRGMEDSFRGAANGKQRREWIAYAQSTARDYEKSIQKLGGLENTIEQKLSSIGDEKIRGNFEALKSAYEGNKGTYEMNVFVSPRTYEAQLRDVLSSLSDISEDVETNEAQESQEKFAEKISEMSAHGLDIRDESLKNKQDFYRALGWKERVWIAQKDWNEWGADMFYAKADELYAEFINGQDTVASGVEKSAENLNPSWRLDLAQMNLDGLDLSNKNLADMETFRQSIGVLNNIWMSEDDWENNGGKQQFEAKMKVLHPEFVDLQKEYLAEEQLSVEDRVEAVKDRISGMSLDGVDITDSNLLDSAAFRRELGWKNRIWMPQDVWKSEGEALFAKKIDELKSDFDAQHQAHKENEKSADFLPEDEVRKIGVKYGLNFGNLRLQDNAHLSPKFKKLDTLLSRNSSLRKLFQNNEYQMVPFFLDMMGNLTGSDFDRLASDLGSKNLSKADLVKTIFGEPRRRFLAKEAKKKSYDSYQRLRIGERQIDPTSITDILEKGILEEPEVVEEDISVAPEEIDMQVEDDAEAIEEDISENEEAEESPEEVDTDINLDFSVSVESEDSEENVSEEETDISEDMDEDIDDVAEPVEEIDSESDDAEELEEVREDSTEAEVFDSGKSADFFEDEVEEDSEEEVVKVRKKSVEADLPKDWEETIEAENSQSAVHFAELYCPEGLLLGKLLKRVEQYVSLVSQNTVTSEIAISDTDLARRVKNSRKIFLDLTEFLLAQPAKDIQKLNFSLGAVSEEGVSLNVLVEKSFGIGQSSFELRF